MDGIIKLTYDKGLVIGLSRNDKHYYVFWGNAPDVLEIDVQWNDNMTDSTITIPFFDNKGRHFTIMSLDKEDDYELAERLLRAAL